MQASQHSTLMAGIWNYLTQLPSTGGNPRAQFYSNIIYLKKEGNRSPSLRSQYHSAAPHCGHQSHSRSVPGILIEKSMNEVFLLCPFLDLVAFLKQLTGLKEMSLLWSAY